MLKFTLIIVESLLKNEKIDVAIKCYLLHNYIMVSKLRKLHEVIAGFLYNCKEIFNMH